MQVGTNDNQVSAGQSEAQAGNIYGNSNTQSQAQTTQPRQEAPVGNTLRSAMLRGGRGHTGRDNNGRVLGELTNKMQELLKTTQDQEVKSYDIRFVPAPRNSIMDDNYANAISVLIMIVGDGDRFAYHTMPIGAEMPPAPVQRNDYNSGYYTDQVQPPRVPTMLMDIHLANVVRKKVEQSVPPGSKIYSADWATVPAEFKLTDSFAIEDLFYNALRACWTELDTKHPDFQYMSLAGSAGDNSNIVSIHLNQDQANQPVEMFDALGLPIRSEIVIDFRSEQSRSTAREMQTENTANVVEFGKVFAYTTINIDPVASRQNQFSTGRRNQDDTQEYVGEVTISGMDIYGPLDLSNVLLFISNTFPLLDVNTRPWVRNYLPRHLQHNTGRGGNFRPRDLSVLNYDYKWKEAGSNVVEPFNVNDEANHTIEDFNDLVSMLIQPAVALGMDIPEDGANTFFLRPFAEAIEVPGAAAAIIKAADSLTDNRFSGYFNKTSGQIITPRKERVLLGYFVDAQGVQRDLRIIDMMYLLNHDGHQNPDIGRQWAATAGGSDQQLAARAKLIESVVPNVTFTGIGVHVVFHADFIFSLDRAIADTGLKPRNEMSREDARLMTRHSTGLMQSGGVLTNFTSSMYSNNNYAPGGGNYRNMAHTRHY